MEKFTRGGVGTGRATAAIKDACGQVFFEGKYHFLVCFKWTPKGKPEIGQSPYSAAYNEISG